MLLIGLVGATGAGKTTLASLLVERRRFVRAHMGQPIKDMLAALGLTQDQLTGSPAARSMPADLLDGRTPRFAMETLGTEWGRRMISQGLWANALERRLAGMRDSGIERVVVDDLRFPTDFEAVEGSGGTLVAVVRAGVSLRRTLSDRIGHHLPWTREPLRAAGLRVVHETEYHWRDANAEFRVANDGTPEDLLKTFEDGCASLELAVAGTGSPSAA